MTKKEEKRAVVKAFLKRKVDVPLNMLDGIADGNCKKCFGRGYIGKEVHTGEAVLCRCIGKRLNVMNKEIEEEKKAEAHHEILKINTNVQ